MYAAAEHGCGVRTAAPAATDAVSRARGVAIHVADVPPATTALPETTTAAAVDQLLMPRFPWDEPLDDTICIEACSNPHGRLVSVAWHPALAAVHLAFQDHRPLVLSPDIVWTRSFEICWYAGDCDHSLKAATSGKDIKTTFSRLAGADSVVQLVKGF